MNRQGEKSVCFRPGQAKRWIEGTNCEPGNNEHMGVVWIDERNRTITLRREYEYKQMKGQMSVREKENEH